MCINHEHTYLSAKIPPHTSHHNLQTSSIQFKSTLCRVASTTHRKLNEFIHFPLFYYSCAVHCYRLLCAMSLVPVPGLLEQISSARLVWTWFREVFFFIFHYKIVNESRERKSYKCDDSWCTKMIVAKGMIVLDECKACDNGWVEWAQKGGELNWKVQLALSGLLLSQRYGLKRRWVVDFSLCRKEKDWKDCFFG